MYKKVATDMNFAQREQDILRYWDEKDIVRRSFHVRDGQQEFTFFDGPPTANGKPHIGHIETRAIKDIIPRYQTMKGKSVLRIAGWDTHGLPVELEVEKMLGLDGKQQIEKYGIEPFIKECKKSVWKYLHEWEEMSKRVGYWADMEHPYITYNDTYIESEWWALKEIHKKGLLYHGHKVVPFCPRCGTALSSHEVAQGYKEVSDTSAFVRFAVKGESNTYFLAWTTTPWTLPSNVALCVNAAEDYCRYQSADGKVYILANALVSTVFGDEEGTILSTVRGKELEGMEYEPLYTFAHPAEKAWYVTCGEYVTLTDGTGIVHIAPAFGEDDAKIGRDYNLPFVQLVDTQGKLTEETAWAGKDIHEVNPLVLEDLEGRGLLFRAVPFTHNYPFCWRCDTPLIYYARSTWFIKMTAVRDNLIANNRSVNWLPDNIKEGRMGNFLENVIDWGLSRERYWGTPLPVWKCPQGHIHVIGSKAELKEMATKPIDEIELHRPYIDEVEITCPECGEPMHRVKEVIDCWFDSGSMPFAQWHYPFENKEQFEKNFPAQFISEAIDQTRGWFYTLLAISTLLFDKAPFQNCIVMGHVQDKNGQKMSKHKGNVVDPWSVLNKQGADAVRWYFYTAGAPWLPSRFYDEAVTDAQRKFMGTLQNTYAFYIMYADIDGFNPTQHKLADCQLSLMDKWILSKLNSLIKTVDENLTNYVITESARAIIDFVDDLSNWYVRRGRERFWGKGMAADKEAAFMTMYTVLESLCRLLAPFLPFMAEDMYLNLVKSVDENAPDSVHLCSFPVCDESMIDTDMEDQMKALLEVIQLGRSCRNAANMKVRIPAAKLYVKGASFDTAYGELAEDELNVKQIIFTEDARAFTTYNLKPQMRTLGPRYGKLLGKIGAALKEMDGNDVVDAFEKGETVTFDVDGTAVTLNKDDVLTSPAQKPGYTAQTENGVTVVLDTNLTPELIREGYAREVISKIQTMRKDADFDVTDRILVWLNSDEEVNSAAIEAKEMIMNGVLALEMNIGGTVDATVSQEWDINGHKGTIAIKKA